tara:strand:+ start:53 stop:553 length:501 start_codon:yes stop_codon:yes gene_type:complete
MITDFDTIKTILTISIFILMAFSLIVTIRYGRVNKWLYILIPVILFLSVSIKTNIESMLGYPTGVNYYSEQIYLSHIIGFEKKWIYVWTIDMKNVNLQPRAYKIKFTVENEKKLAEAKKGAKLGIPQGLKMPVNPLGGWTDQTLERVPVNRLQGINKDQNQGEVDE